MQQKLFGERLKKVRKERGLTQEEFGKLLGISPGYVSEMEAGLKAPSETILLLIKYRLEINIDWLKSGEGAETREPGEVERLAGDDQKIIDIVRILKTDSTAREVIYEILQQDKGNSRVANTVQRFLARRMDFALHSPGEGPDGDSDTKAV
jgi:transcriptional regulator with XRE-family HTH domain